MNNLECDVKALRERTKMNRKEFCTFFDIPYRTVEDWENKKSTCASYLYKLMEEKLRNENLLRDEENNDNIWNVVLYTEENGKLKKPTNVPSISGQYLCTCISRVDKKESTRCLQVLEYDAKRNCWHICRNPNKVVDSVLAWTNTVSMCDFHNYEWRIGGYFVKKNKENI